MEEFRIAIVGGRDFNDYNRLKKLVANLLRNKAETHKIIIVCGMAKGADLLGKQFGNECGYTVEEYHAKWEDLNTRPLRIKTNLNGQYNALAGHNRNAEMRAAADAVIAFWDGKSRGTREMINACKSESITLRVYNY